MLSLREAKNNILIAKKEYEDLVDVFNYLLRSTLGKKATFFEVICYRKYSDEIKARFVKELKENGFQFYFDPLLLTENDMFQIKEEIPLLHWLLIRAREQGKNLDYPIIKITEEGSTN